MKNSGIITIFLLICLGLQEKEKEPKNEFISIIKHKIRDKMNKGVINWLKGIKKKLSEAKGIIDELIKNAEKCSIGMLDKINQQPKPPKRKCDKNFPSFSDLLAELEKNHPLKHPLKNKPHKTGEQENSDEEKSPTNKDDPLDNENSDHHGKHGSNNPSKSKQKGKDSDKKESDSNDENDSSDNRKGPKDSKERGKDYDEHKDKKDSNDENDSSDSNKGPKDSKKNQRNPENDFGKNNDASKDQNVPNQYLSTSSLNDTPNFPKIETSFNPNPSFTTHSMNQPFIANPIPNYQDTGLVSNPHTIPSTTTTTSSPNFPYSVNLTPNSPSGNGLSVNLNQQQPSSCLSPCPPSCLPSCDIGCCSPYMFNYNPLQLFNFDACPNQCMYHCFNSCDPMCCNYYSYLKRRSVRNRSPDSDDEDLN